MCTVIHLELTITTENDIRISHILQNCQSDYKQYPRIEKHTQKTQIYTKRILQYKNHRKHRRYTKNTTKTTTHKNTTKYYTNTKKAKNISNTTNYTKNTTITTMILHKIQKYYRNTKTTKRTAKYTTKYHKNKNAKNKQIQIILKNTTRIQKMHNNNLIIQIIQNNKI